MLTIDEAIEKFNREIPEEVQLSCEADFVLKPLEEIEERYGITLSPLLILFVLGEVVGDDLITYIENEFSFEEKKAAVLASEIQDKIFKPLFDRINFLNDHPEKEMTLEQEKYYVENIFKKGILAELNYDPIVKDAVNRRLFFILARDADYRRRLEQSMYDNVELLTSQSIMIDGREQPATISNWLKDFIAHYGSQSYNSVSVSSFLVNSDNGKKLSAEDRAKLADVIKIYTNIKFFPDSMPSDNGEDWQIIPYEIEVMPDSERDFSEETTELAEEKLKVILHEVPLPNKPANKTELKTISPSLPPLAPAPVPAKIVEPVKPLAETGDEEDLVELRNMLLQYPAGSLERAAIEEEIKKKSG
ncbi:MAG: hypothetical protein NTY12_04040 [Candidatus Falkowbacteria bacterium]|nr:hypothetical protein [Candidatus Falkowbacteria bacterium]